MKPALRIALALLLWLPAARAFDFGALKPQGYVSDFAGVVNPMARQELEAYAGRLEAATGVQLAFVTLRTLEGEPVEDVANLLFRKWGVGQKGKNEGILLLLVTQDRRSRLEVGYGLEPIIPDGYAGSLLREMRPALRAGQYGEAFLIAAGRLGERIAAAKGVSLSGPAPLRNRQRQTPEIPWVLVLGGLGLLLWLMGMGGGRRRTGAGYLPNLLLGHMIGRHLGAGYSGGGFGGYDSGDGFGGFGGGDSGGGGASSDW